MSFSTFFDLKHPGSCFKTPNHSADARCELAMPSSQLECHSEIFHACLQAGMHLVCTGQWVGQGKGAGTSEGYFLSPSNPGG